MPVRNTAQFLPDCIKSIQAQTYTDWELIAIDDHSEDDCPKILEAFALADSRIRWYTNPGERIIPALVEGLNRSKGHLVTRMDSDDLMPTNRLEIMYKACQTNGTGHIITGLVKYFPSEAVGPGYQAYESWLNQMCINQSHWEHLYEECVVASPAWMMFRSDLEQCGGFLAKSYPEDYDLCFRWYKQGLKVLGLNELVLLWRQHDLRTSNTWEAFQPRNFTRMKMHYFLELHHQGNRPIFLWGVGDRGKDIAQFLQEQNISFHWISAHPGKIEKSIQGQKIKGLGAFKSSQLKQGQHLISFAECKGKQAVKNWSQNLGLNSMEDFFFLA